MFRIEEEEDFVLPDRTAKASSVVIALEGKILAAGKVGETRALIAEQVKAFSVPVVRARTGDDVDRTRGRELG